MHFLSMLHRLFEFLQFQMLSFSFAVSVLCGQFQEDNKFLGNLCNNLQQSDQFKMLDSILVWSANVGMAVGPIVGYVSQYRLIKATKSVGSFSIDICGILLFANILRLNFYIFKQYEITLVFQSIIMITMQIILLRECSKYPVNEPDPNVAEEIEPALEESRDKCVQRVEEFWRWNGFEKYGVAILFFVFCTFMLSLIFKFTPIANSYGQLVGLVALMSQSVLILPQIIKNIEKQSTKGLSHMLVILNLSGDVFKLAYFLVNNQPFQFILCGIIQVVLDSFVILQIFYYSMKQRKKRKSSKNSPDSPIKPSKIKQQKQLDPIDSEANLDERAQTLQSQRQNECDLKQNKQDVKQPGKQAMNISKMIKQQIQQIKEQQKKEQENYHELKQEIDSDEEKGETQTKNSQVNSEQNDDQNKSESQKDSQSHDSEQKQAGQSG